MDEAPKPEPPPNSVWWEAYDGRMEVLVYRIGDTEQSAVARYNEWKKTRPKFDGDVPGRLVRRFIDIARAS